MLVSKNWLNDYVDISDRSPENIAEILTGLGLEVESTTTTQALDENIVVGKVLSVQAHPNADALRLCKVDAGLGSELSIVCGAPNVRTGLTVAVALKGAALPDGTKIKATKIRGEASEGMICSEAELNISENHAGIMELSADLMKGKPFKSYMNTQDSLFEIKLTPNRSDCLSYIGIARDIAAKLDKPLKTPIAPMPIPQINHKVNVVIENEDDCARFCAAMISGVKAVTSPLWLRKKLEASGMNAHNILVDVTNFVLLEYGQPIHAYDRRDVKGDTLKAVSRKGGLPFVTLKDIEITTDVNDILIYDTERMIGLAGIMGGQNSEIKEDTSEVIIEVAHFSPQKIRKTARRTGIATESSYRFERGVDMERAFEVLARTCALILQCSQEQGVTTAHVSSAPVDVYPQTLVLKRIALRLPRVRAILANPVFLLDTCVQQLEKIGCKLLDKTEERMLFEIPSWRADLQREIDLIEEIARLEGYDKVPYEIPRLQISPGPENRYIEFNDDIKRSAANLGLTEIMTLPFLSEADVQNLRLSPLHGLWPKIKLANALNESVSLLQTSLLPGLLKAILRNRNHGRRGSKLFEIGRGFFDKHLSGPWSDDPHWQHFLRPSRLLTHRARDEKDRPVERDLLTGTLDQPLLAKEWNHAEKAATFFEAKEIVSALAKMHGLRVLKWKTIEPEHAPFLHPHASAWIFNELGERKLGWAGELHPQVALAYDLEDEAPACFELDLEAVFEEAHETRMTVEASAIFPPVTRDLAFTIAKHVRFETFEQASLNFPGRKHLNSVRLFDLYEGEQVGEDRKSFAASYTFQSLRRTLTDHEVDQEVGALLAYLRGQLGAVQR
ncbi:MAG: phenylalanine--tRNA ligase subunit beta [Deltaproteobacteria bacterium]|nr:phenylalanine--tRNA ligase subunit beta [Deltaproteobacteria bacterium]